jgi:plasmid maintenance system antidote protein VapI
MKRSKKERQPVSGPLRDTIQERGLTAYWAAKRAGVSVDAVRRFLNDERGLTLRTVDKLALTLDLTLCPDHPPSRRRS